MSSFSVQPASRTTEIPRPQSESSFDRARDLGVAGDLDAAVAFVRERSELRGEVETGMLQAGNPGGIGDLGRALLDAASRTLEAVGKGLGAAGDAIDTAGDAVGTAANAVRDAVINALDAVTSIGPTRSGFATIDAPGRAALVEANPASISENREFGGLIYKAADGTYGYTEPTRGTGTSFDPTSVSIPGGTKLVGDYHVHGDFSTADASGSPVRTSDPASDDYNSDQFSLPDLRGIIADAAGK